MFGFGKQQQQQQVKDPNQDPGKVPEPSPTGLDKFSHLIDNAKNADDQGNAPSRTDVKALFKDQQFLQGLTSNFRNSMAASISPETKQKLENNDPDAMQSMIIDIAQASYMQSLEHSASLQDLVLGEVAQDISTNTDNLVNNKIKDYQYSSSIPQLNNPIIQLGVQAFTSKLREQNPDISPDELKSQIGDYLQEMSKSFNGDPEADTKGDSKDEGIDWIADLGLEDMYPATTKE